MARRCHHRRSGHSQSPWARPPHLIGRGFRAPSAGSGVEAGVRASARALLAVAGMAGIGIAASPEPARGATPRHLAWTVLGAVTIAVWPAFAARRAAPRPLILSVYGSAAVTAVFVALLGWLLAETRDGSVLGLAERLTTSIQTCWPFIIAVALRRTRRPRPGLAIGGSGAAKDGAADRRQTRNKSLCEIVLLKSLAPSIQPVPLDIVDHIARHQIADGVLAMKLFTNERCGNRKARGGYE